MREAELRMYFFTIYQLTGIQKGIQCGHAALEYVEMYGERAQYKEFIKKHKTWIVLNGGVTQNNLMPEEGSINFISTLLHQQGIEYASFREPDLNNAMTAVCFLVDERVFNKIEFPDYGDWLIDNPNNMYHNWVDFIGGNENATLREIIDGKRLA